MAGLTERLASIREEAFGKRGKSAFARALGIPLTSYLNFENGRVPPMDVMVKMIALTRVNPRWLVHGRGPRHLPEDIALPPAEDAASLLADLLEESSRLQAELLSAKRSAKPAIAVIPGNGDPTRWLAEHEQIQATAEEYLAVPILSGKAAAGPPENVLEADREGWMLCPRSAVKHPKTTFAFPTVDDAMAPAIPKGSVVGIDCSLRDPGRILRSKRRLVAVRQSGQGCVVRQLEKAEAHWLFLPMNSSTGRRPLVWPESKESPVIGQAAFVFSTL